MREKAKWIALVLACLMLTSLAACVQQKPAAEERKPVILVFGRGADSDRLDPARTTSGESAKITLNVFDTLVQFKPGSTDVEPALAEAYEPSADGKEWTFHLRRGVKFHDGTPFNADAVLFTFERQLDKNHKYYYEDMEYAEMTLGVVQEVVKADEYTVKFVLKHPFGPFLRNMAMFCNAIVSPTAVEKYGDDFFKNPVGTGPFKFVKWERDSQIVLEANKEYWGGAPRVDQVIFRVIPENSVRLAELQAGSIHMMDGLDPNDIATVEKDANLTLMKQPGLNINYLCFPTLKKPFSDVRVRQAISCAINKQNIVNYLYQGQAWWPPAPSPRPSWTTMCPATRTIPKRPGNSSSRPVSPRA